MPEQGIYSQSIKKQTMAEQMAAAIQELILSGELESGVALPTEPELAEQFGVSRAVVRDATRILMARGLVEVQHGRGVFVTQPDNEAFGDALLLALQRVGASAWDVELFEQILLPEVIALAAANATQVEIQHLHHMAAGYEEFLSSYHKKWWGKKEPLLEQERLRSIWQSLLQTFMEISGNKVIQQLGRPLLKLRNLRHWAEDAEDTPQSAVAAEMAVINLLIKAVESKDPAKARAITARVLALPPAAVEAMRRTPVGEVSQIPIPLPKPSLDDRNE